MDYQDYRRKVTDATTAFAQQEGFDQNHPKIVTAIDSLVEAVEFADKEAEGALSPGGTSGVPVPITTEEVVSSGRTGTSGQVSDGNVTTLGSTGMEDGPSVGDGQVGESAEGGPALDGDLVDGGGPVDPASDEGDSSTTNTSKKKKH